MAPKKKGKKKPAAGDWSDDDVGEPTPEGPTEALASDAATAGAAPPASKAKKAKGKKGKGKGKAGDDWGSEDDVSAVPMPPEAGSDAEEAPQPPARARQRKQASVFAMLDDGEDDDGDGGDDGGKPESESPADVPPDSAAEAPAIVSEAAIANDDGEEQVLACCYVLHSVSVRAKPCVTGLMHSQHR